jgi:hypothetical protein
MNPKPMKTAATGARSPEGHSDQYQHGRLHDERDHVPQHPARHDGEPAHRGDPEPLDDAGPPVRDDGKAHERRAEQTQLDEQAGHEELVSVAGSAQRC